MISHALSAQTEARRDARIRVGLNAERALCDASNLGDALKDAIKAQQDVLDHSPVSFGPDEDRLGLLEELLKHARRLETEIDALLNDMS